VGTLNIIMTGIGGQGIILASDVIAEAAMLQGLDVKKTDSIGMAQRGGSVISHLRLGNIVNSPLIAEGDADILLGMEKLEAARAVIFLKEGGVALVNNYAVSPSYSKDGIKKYPDDNAVSKIIGFRTEKIHFVEGLKAARSLGNMRAMNIYLLGALSNYLPLTSDAWLISLKSRLPEKHLNVNLKAFKQGQKEANCAGIG